MYLGKIVELADKRALFAQSAAPLHRGAAVGGAGARPDARDESASSSRATCRARSTRRRAAAFTPAAPMRSTAAGVEEPVMQEVAAGTFRRVPSARQADA